MTGPPNSTRTAPTIKVDFDPVAWRSKLMAVGLTAEEADAILNPPRRKTMTLRTILKGVSVGLMAAGAVAGFALGAAVPGFDVDPAWRFGLGCFLAANAIITAYLPTPKPESGRG